MAKSIDEMIDNLIVDTEKSEEVFKKIAKINLAEHFKKEAEKLLNEEKKNVK